MRVEESCALCGRLWGVSSALKWATGSTFQPWGVLEAINEMIDIVKKGEAPKIDGISF